MEELNVMFQHLDKGLSAVLLVYFIFKLNPLLSEINKQLTILTRASDSMRNELDDLQDDLKTYLIKSKG